MPKGGAKPKRRVTIQWSANFAYAIGLITTDGNLSSSGRTVSLTSTDEEQILNFMNCLKVKNKIGLTKGKFTKKRCMRVQVGDVVFYRFLIRLGLMPRKSKIMGAIKIPRKYFFDFLRGHFDGDGSSYAYWDPRWRSSFMFYITFLSASKAHIYWLQKKIHSFIHISGHITKSVNDSVYQLKYAKSDSLQLLPRMYHKKNLTYLSRKYLKIKEHLATIGKLDLI